MKNHLSFYCSMTKSNSPFSFIFITLLILLIIIYFYPTKEDMKVNKRKRQQSSRRLQQIPSVQYIPQEFITWKPYVLDIYNQPAYHAYFYDNHYMYPLF